MENSPEKDTQPGNITELLSTRKLDFDDETLRGKGKSKFIKSIDLYELMIKSKLNNIRGIFLTKPYGNPNFILEFRCPSVYLLLPTVRDFTIPILLETLIECPGRGGNVYAKVIHLRRRPMF